jgi:mono/diheme cytochrome c family protein
MNTTMRFRQRAAILAAVLMALTLASVPFLGTAQDATPEATPVADEAELLEEGERIYTNVCLACHQPDGRGIEGIYPPLAGNPLITGDDPTYFVTTVLNGRGGMPRFDTTFDDEEIASVVSYVRQAWENDADSVSPDEVAEIRAETEAELEAPTPTPEGQVPSDEAEEGGEDHEATPED